eukprot:5583135-Pleurochrysis_carterae.AAC.3
MVKSFRESMHRAPWQKLEVHLMLALAPTIIISSTQCKVLVFLARAIWSSYARIARSQRAHCASLYVRTASRPRGRAARRAGCGIRAWRAEHGQHGDHRRAQRHRARFGTWA